MSNSIIFSPTAPTWLIIAVAVFAVIAIGISLLRSPLPGVLRILAVLGLFGLLLDPKWRVAEETPLDDIALILIDRSLSQALDSRQQTAEEAANILRARLESTDNLTVITTPVDGVEETKLGEAVRRALGDAPRQRIAGVFLITDGQTTDTVAPGILPDEAPFHVLLTGRASETDRKITLLNAPRYGVVRESVDVSFRIDDLGPDGEALNLDAQTRVVLKVDGDVVLEQPVPIGSEVSFNAPLDSPGRTVIELTAAPLDGELSARNNTAILPISVIRDRLRVLLISGEPHAGERVWRNLLKSDPAIDLVHFTILRPQEKSGSDGVIDQRELALIEFPYDELFIEKLQEFDLLIFDRYTYRGVLSSFHFDSIARYVERGGAVLVASGPEFNTYLSLAERRNFSYILPVQPLGEASEQAFRPRISQTGERHPVTADLPEKSFWGRWLRIMPSVARSGQSLMEDDQGRPLLVMDRVGEGRVGVLLSDHVWLWARGFDGGGPHAELLRRIAHWLMKEPDLEEERLTLSDNRGALAIERHSVNDNVGPVILTTPSGETREIILTQGDDGLFRAALEDGENGLYRATNDGLFAVGAVGLAAPPEFEDIVMDRRPLTPAVEASNSGFFFLRQENGDPADLPTVRRISAAGARFGSNWVGVTRRNASRVEAVRATPIAPPWAWLIGIGAALLGAWLADGGIHRLTATKSKTV